MEQKSKTLIDPQENVIIGNFLYALGLGVGVRKGKQAPPAAVNLLQQTSYDKALGDVMLYFPGATRLFEFKRRSNTDRDKELRKLRTLKPALRNLPHMSSVSRRVHFFVETGSSKDGQEFSFNVRPYLDLQSAQAGATTFDKFVNSLVSEATGLVDVEANRLANVYIRDFVGTWGGAEGHSSTSLLVSVGSNGGVHYVVLDDLADLEATAEQVFRYQMTRHIAKETLVAERISQLEHDQAMQRQEQRAHTRDGPEHGYKVSR